MAALTTIPITREVRDRLKRIGTKGQTYNELIAALLEEHEARILYDRQKRILETSEFIPLDQV